MCRRVEEGEEQWSVGALWDEGGTAHTEQPAVGSDGAQKVIRAARDGDGDRVLHRFAAEDGDVDAAVRGVGVAVAKAAVGVFVDAE